MTDIMTCAYSDMFSGATVYSGMAATCFLSAAGTVDGWNASCAHGDMQTSQSYWTEVLRQCTQVVEAIMYQSSCIKDRLIRLLTHQICMKRLNNTGLWGYNAIAETNLTDTPNPDYTTQPMCMATMFRASGRRVLGTQCLCRVIRIRHGLVFRSRDTANIRPLVNTEWDVLRKWESVKPFCIRSGILITSLVR